MIQYLNGIEGNENNSWGVFTPTPLEQPVRGLFDHELSGIAALDRQRQNIDFVTDENVFDRYNGLNGIEDVEIIRNYLVRTKAAVDGCPQLIQCYVNPQEFSNMLDYVLRYWDTEQREAAVEAMALKERRLITAGKVSISDINEDGVGGGFFTALWACVKPQNEMAEASQEILSVYKGKLRNAAAYARLHNGKVDASMLNGLSGLDDERVTTGLLYGWDFEEQRQGLNGTENVSCGYIGSGRAYCEKYLRNMHYLVSQKPSDFFADEKEGNEFVNALKIVLQNFQNGNADAVIEQMANNGALSGRLRKFFKKVAKGVKKAAKTVAKGVKTAVKAVGKAFKKLGKAIVKITKKVVKFLIRFNPITAGVRGILILAARFNWFNLAKRCYPGSLTKDEAVSKLNVTAEYWEKSNQGYKKFSKAYTKIGGKESALKKYLAKGYTKVWKGGDEVSKKTVKAAKKGSVTDKEFEDTYNSELKDVELKKQGTANTTLKEDTTLEIGTSKTEQTTTEVTANEYETKQATSFYAETDTSKVNTTIPKGTKLIVDADAKGNPLCYNQTGDTGTTSAYSYYRVKYNNVYGIVAKTCLVATSSVSGLNGVLRNKLKGLKSKLKTSIKSGKLNLKSSKPSTKRVGVKSTRARVKIKKANGGTAVVSSVVKTIDVANKKTGAVNGISVAYDESGHTLGIAGIDDAAIIGSAVTILGGIVSAVLKALGKDKAANIAAGVTAAAGATTGVMSVVAAAKNGNTTSSTDTTTTSSGNTSSTTPSGISNAAQKINNAVQTGAQIVSAAMPSVATAVQSFSAASNSGNQATQTNVVTSQPTTTTASYQAQDIQTAQAKTSTEAATTTSTSSSKKYWLIGGAAIAAILGVFALTRKKDN